MNDTSARKKGIRNHANCIYESQYFDINSDPKDKEYLKILVKKQDDIALETTGYFIYDTITTLTKYLQITTNTNENFLPIYLKVSNELEKQTVCAKLSALLFDRFHKYDEFYQNELFKIEAACEFPGCIKMTYHRDYHDLIKTLYRDVCETLSGVIGFNEAYASLDVNLEYLSLTFLPISDGGPNDSKKNVLHSYRFNHDYLTYQINKTFFIKFNGTVNELKKRKVSLNNFNAKKVGNQKYYIKMKPFAITELDETTYHKNLKETEMLQTSRSCLNLK